MAFNFSVFKVRAASAVIFALIMVSGLLWSERSFFQLFLIIQFGCLYEYQKLMRLIFPNYVNVTAVHKWGVLAMGMGVMFAHSSNTISIGNLVLQKIGMPMVGLVLVGILVSELINKKFNAKNWAITIFGLLYISFSLSLFFPLRAYMANTFFGDFGYAIPLILISTIWVNDTMAYLVGSFIGKTPLSSISPNKTWEGTIAGIILSVVLVTKVMGIYIPVSEKVILYISIVASIAGTFGDLFESKLKRLAGVKDSGKMMPGHGGFLDRFDSIILATPFVWVLLQFLY
ncbi:MAG: phosphatidate cytidylyltransferase [Sediminibacterium sp.]|jgi:phosphatidate cytidylyltransferase